MWKKNAIHRHNARITEKKRLNRSDKPIAYFQDDAAFQISKSKYIWAHFRLLIKIRSRTMGGKQQILNY